MKRIASEKFPEVTRLLVLKRYEQPPFGYFDHFADRVIARLEADETGQTRGWWSWLMELIETRPLISSAAGVAFSAALLTSFQLADSLDFNPSNRPGTSGLASQTFLVKPADTQPMIREPSTFGTFASVSLTSLSPAVQNTWSDSGKLRGQGWGVKPVSFVTGQ